VRDRVHGVEIVGDLQPAGRYVYQPGSPASFYERYQSTDVVAFTDCRPDLIGVLPRRQRRDSTACHIGVKSQSGLKLSHRIRPLYTLILGRATGTRRIAGRVQAGHLALPRDNPETADVRAIRPPLENFLRRGLQIPMEAGSGGTMARVTSARVGCEWFPNCRRRCDARTTSRASPHPVTQAIPRERTANSLVGGS